MSVSVTVRSDVPAIKARVSRQVEALVAKAALDIEARARAQAPVDTGFLKSSIEAVQEGRAAWRVEAAAEYAIFVEFGTRRMGARPFLIPALEAVRGPFLAAVRGAVN